MTTPESFLFVSHVSEDRSAAMEIVVELERRGLRCWIAPRDVQPGKPFDDEIADAIDGSLAMLLIFSERCNDSEYIRREVTVAGESQKLIIPFRIENAPPRRGLRVRLSDLHWIDGFVSREHAIEELYKTFRPTEFSLESYGRTRDEPSPDVTNRDVPEVAAKAIDDGERELAAKGGRSNTEARRLRKVADAAGPAHGNAHSQAVPPIDHPRKLRFSWLAIAAFLAAIIILAGIGFRLTENTQQPATTLRSSGELYGGEAVRVGDVASVDIIDAVDFGGAGERMQVSTAPGYDGIIRRFEVQARESRKVMGCIFASQLK